MIHPKSIGLWGIPFIAFAIIPGPAASSREPERPKFSVTITIGIETAADKAQEPYQFSSIGSADFDAQGNIYVFDSKDSCIKVFTKTGDFLRRFLKPGQGPDEIENAYGFKILRSNNHIFVLHQHGFQIKEFDEAGHFIRSHPLPEQVLNASFVLIDEKQLLYVARMKYGETRFNNLKILSLETNKLIREFAPVDLDYFTGLQRVAVKDGIVWTCPGDLLRAEAFDPETGRKLKTIPLAEDYAPPQVIRWGNSIQKFRLFNYAQPFLIGDDLYFIIVRQSFTKKPESMLDKPLKREANVYRLAGDRLVEEQEFPEFDFLPEFLAAWENKLLVSSSGYDLYPRLKVIELH